MKVSVVISACDNRERLFTMALDTWERQSMPKEDFEIIVVDDAVREELRDLCRERATLSGLGIRFVRIDSSRSAIPATGTIPVLTNNVGFRKACGDVVVVTGPETLQAQGNLEAAVAISSKQVCAYGLVFKANPACTRRLSDEWGAWRDRSLTELLEIPGAKTACLTRPPHPPAYYYLMVVARRHILAIGGLDERFLGGLCGEDDDFANRMRLQGVTPVFEHSIFGLHQDHSGGGGNRIDRASDEGYRMRIRNFCLIKENLKSGDPVANRGRDWGSDSLVVLDERYGEIA